MSTASGNRSRPVAETRILAVDLGATSVRVAALDLADRHPRPEILHRWAHAPVKHHDGSLRWDWHSVVAEVERGLEAGLAAGPVASIGVDGWAVDYGLVDAHGQLVSPPFSYRDGRTANWAQTADRIGRDRLYELSGIQLMPINTVFQVAAHDRSELARAQHLLLLPDLLVHHLTGWIRAERSNASTTALLDARSGTWSQDLLDAVGLDPQILPPLGHAGQQVGRWRGIPVHLVGSHDTASAFVAVPGIPTARTAIVSSGTWVLVGTERPDIDTSPHARARNFSNEAGALGGFRFLKNITGFWLLEQCRSQWGNPPIDHLVAEAASVQQPGNLVDPTDDRFLAPDDMEREIRVGAGLPPSASRAEITRCILESIAAATARVVNELGEVTGTRAEELFVVGGGARIQLVNELLARHTGRSVIVGSPEAACIGNAGVQGLALGVFATLDQARQWIARGAQRFGPDATAAHKRTEARKA